MYTWTCLILSLLYIQHASCTIYEAGQIISRSGFLGCRFSSKVCEADELCVDDNLFGSCQKLFADQLERDLFRYQLKPQQLYQLQQTLNGLARLGYTWHHLYTQCILTRSLLEFRHGVRVPEDFCRASATLSNHSSAGISQHDGSTINRGDEKIAGNNNGDKIAKSSEAKGPSSDVKIDELLTGDLYESLVQLIKDKMNDKERGVMQKQKVSGVPPTDTVSHSVIGWHSEQDEVDTFLSSLSQDDLLALKQFLIGEAKRINESTNGGNQVRRHHGWVPPINEEVESVKRDDQLARLEAGSEENNYTTGTVLTSNTSDDGGQRIEDNDGMEQKIVEGRIVESEGSPTTLKTIPDHSHNNVESRTKARRSSFIAVYVLLCVLCVLTAVALVLLYQHQCSASNKTLMQHLTAWTDSLVGKVSGSGKEKCRVKTKYMSGHDEYQDLCRQRMLDAQSEYEDDEREEELTRGDTPTAAATTATTVRPPPVRSVSYNSSSSKKKNGKVAAWVASAGRSLSYAQTRDEDDEGTDAELDVTTGHLILSYMEDLAVNQDRLCREWHALCEPDEPSGTGSSTTVALEAENSRKNRTVAVLPYEQTRVRLDASVNASHSDYINASHLSDHDPRNVVYIATQGPLPGTVDDFWQMVWEQNCVVIVNLTTLASSNGTIHCHRYWPRADNDRFHIYEVMLMSEHSALDKTYIVRNFSLRNVAINQVRTVTQFQYLAWPDHGVPASIESLLHFRAKVNKSYRGQSSPIVVHCSDGAGRTGTYCLIDLVLNRIVKGVKEIDLAATLEHLREQRVNLVHSQEQFEFAVAVVIAEVQRLLRVNRHATY